MVIVLNYECVKCGLLNSSCHIKLYYYLVILRNMKICLIKYPKFIVLLYLSVLLRVLVEEFIIDVAFTESCVLYYYFIMELFIINKLKILKC